MRAGRVVVPALAIASVAIYVARLAEHHTIEVVRARHLLPRWDVATHLGHGWLDYHLLVSGQIHRMLWDLWLQGYWPPVLSMYQVPFYLVLGGEITAGLWSSLVAFVLVAVIGAVVLLKERDGSGFLAASVFVSLLISSPFLLAYATVTMTEMLGAAAQLFVLFCYQRWRRCQDGPHARLFAISLTVLFFVKYNYFVLLVVPLLLYEWLEHTSGWTLSRRLTRLWDYTRRVLSSATGVFLLLYVVGLLLVTSTGGFRFEIFGQRISVRSVGSSGHVVIYILLLRLWYLHRHGRIDWHRLFSADTRVRPMLLWFVLPVTVWLAAPYPNHLRDFANLLINRPLGEPTVMGGAVTYLDALRDAYFFNSWVLVAVVVVFAIAGCRFREQPPLVRWMIIAIPLQFAAIGLHQTRFPRFMLLTVVLLCLVAAGEIGRWLTGTTARRAAAGLLAVPVLGAGVVAAHHVVTEERFTSVAFENYTDSEPLHEALSDIRRELDEDDRLLIVGQSNDLSPALFRWELGPPSGITCFPFPLGGAGRLDPALASHILLVVPLEGGAAPLDAPSFDPARLTAITADIERGDLLLRREFPLDDLGVSLRLYVRPSRPTQTVECAILQ